MSDGDAAGGDADEPEAKPDELTAPGPAAGDRTVGEELQDLRGEIDRLRQDVEERTVDRSTIEADLRRYVRARIRRGHARGWGPYLVLLYGAAMTVGAFAFLSGGWAILAMIVIWLSTLGLYVLMLLVGAGLAVAGLPGRGVEALNDWRS